MAAPHPALLALTGRGDIPPDVRITRSVADSAIEHGVAPLLDHLAQSDEVNGDHNALVKVAVQRLDSVAMATDQTRALATLLQAAQTAGVELAVFKGIAIGGRWYHQADLRPSVDIDVFVNPADAHLMGGFVEAVTGEPTSRQVINDMVAEGRVFEHPLIVDGVAIDLHIDPMNLVVPTRQLRLVWERTELVGVPGGRVVRTLDLEMSIVQSLLHAFRDNFADLLHLHDVVLMIDDDPDWEFIESFAATEGWTDIIRFSLAFVCDTYGRTSPLPREISATNRFLVAAFWPARILLRGSDSLARSHHRQTLVSLLVEGRRAEVVGALVRRAFPPRAVVDQRFPGCDCPYPIALLRWRLAQRAELKRRYPRSRWTVARRVGVGASDAVVEKPT